MGIVFLYRLWMEILFNEVKFLVCLPIWAIKNGCRPERVKGHPTTQPKVHFSKSFSCIFTLILFLKKCTFAGRRVALTRDHKRRSGAQQRTTHCAAQQQQRGRRKRRLRGRSRTKFKMFRTAQPSPAHGGREAERDKK